MKKLAIITTHPIQYYAPLFKLLHQRQQIAINVFYTLGNAANYDAGFGKTISWDIPLLENYPFEWAENVAKSPGSDRFGGIITPGLIEQVSRWKPDAILVFGWAYNSHLKLIRHFKNRVPLYFRGDSTLLNEPVGIKKTLKYFFLRWIYSHFDHAFYVGKNNEAYFIKYGLKEQQLSFAPHAVDNKRFENSRAEDVLSLRASLGISGDEILILYAGKFEPVKNLHLFMSGFIALNNQKVHLLMVGNGIHELELKEIANPSPISANIHFRDFENQSYMPVLYQAADLFCLPSKSETWGLGVNEAMACSKAILASDKVGCAADLVKEGENGYVFRASDVSDLTERLTQLTKDKDDLVKFGERSKAIIADWSFERTVTVLENHLLKTTGASF